MAEEEKDSPELEVARLFRLAGHEVTQAVGDEPGTVDWFATPREGVTRPRTYFRAWSACPERLDEALKELEWIRTVKRADRALGVIMAGALPAGYQGDLGERATEAITYRRLALEVSGIADRVRARAKRGDREEGRELYPSLRGQTDSGELVDAASYINAWANETTNEDLLVTGPEHASVAIPIRQAIHERAVLFTRNPESVTPLVGYEKGDPITPYAEGAAIPVTYVDVPAPLRPVRKLVYTSDEMAEAVDPSDFQRGERHLRVLLPSPEELDGWLRDQLGDQVYQRFLSAREAEPAFRAVLVEWSEMGSLVAAMQVTPSTARMRSDEWMVQVISRYMARHESERLDALEAMAFGQFAFGTAWSKTDTIDYFKDEPLPPPTWLENWNGFLLDGEAPILNRLVRDYLIARRIARNVDAGDIEILTRHQFPREYVLLFLAVLSPSAAQRAAEMRSQIETEVECRLQLTLAHTLKRSAGAVRSHLKAIQRHVERTSPGALEHEFARIEEEAAFQCALAEQTRLWHEVPESEVIGLSLESSLASIVDDLRAAHPGVAFESAVDPALRVRATQEVLREILHCLLENAFQAVAFADDLQSPRVRVEARTEGGTVRLDVLDNGPGIAAGDRERIFDLYVTTKKGGENRPLGTGMGLPIARRYAEHVGGQVGLDPEREETCFFVRLVAWRDIG